MVNQNPIQQVLQAERDAGAEVEKARQESERQIADVRRWAQEWMRRAESRIQDANLRYARTVREQSRLETEALQKRVRLDIAKRRVEAESQLPQLVEEMYRQRWSKS